MTWRSSRITGRFACLSEREDAAAIAVQRSAIDLDNPGLSERRAEAVKHYLIEKFQLPAANLSTVGYGKRTLRNKDNPFAAESRRVQIVNLASAVEAER